MSSALLLLVYTPSALWPSFSGTIYTLQCTRYLLVVVSSLQSFCHLQLVVFDMDTFSDSSDIVHPREHFNGPVGGTVNNALHIGAVKEGKRFSIRWTVPSTSCYNAIMLYALFRCYFCSINHVINRVGKHEAFVCLPSSITGLLVY